MYKLLLPLMLSFLLVGCVGEPLLFTFNTAPQTYFHRNISASVTPYSLPKSASQKSLPVSFKYKGWPVLTSEFINRTGTGGLLVLHKGEIVFEKYFQGTNRHTKFTSWSVAKSITSALIGIAIEQQYINSVDDLVSDYVPELLSTAYADVTIKDALQMSSGVAFTESGASPDSDAFQLLLAITDSNDDYIYTLTEKSHPSGTYNSYASSDTQVLGMVLSRATGKSVSEYLDINIWQPLGAESSALWVTDPHYKEATYCCFSAVLRDFAKFGQLYLNGGEWQGQQLVPTNWVAASLATSEPQLVPGNNPQSNDTWGYGYQWWIPDLKNDFMAIGIFNQFIYIDPDNEIVIVKNGANQNYILNDMEEDHLYFFRKISQELSKTNVQPWYYRWLF